MLPPYSNVDPAARRWWPFCGFPLGRRIFGQLFHQRECRSTIWLPWVLAKILEGRDGHLDCFGGSPLGSPSPWASWSCMHHPGCLEAYPPLPYCRAGQCLSVYQLNSKCKAPMLPSHMELSPGHWDIAGTQKMLVELNEGRLCRAQSGDLPIVYSHSLWVSSLQLTQWDNTWEMPSSRHFQYEYKEGLLSICGPCWGPEASQIHFL